MLAGSPQFAHMVLAGSGALAPEWHLDSVWRWWLIPFPTLVETGRWREANLRSVRIIPVDQHLLMDRGWVDG